MLIEGGRAPCGERVPEANASVRFLVAGSLCRSSRSVRLDTFSQPLSRISASPQETTATGCKEDDDCGICKSGGQGCQLAKSTSDREGRQFRMQNNSHASPLWRFQTTSLRNSNLAHWDISLDFKLST